MVIESCFVLFFIFCKYVKNIGVKLLFDNFKGLKKKLKRSLMLLVENFFDKILLSVNNFVGCMI